jgi:hypothetical protein
MRTPSIVLISAVASAAAAAFALARVLRKLARSPPADAPCESATDPVQLKATSPYLISTCDAVAAEERLRCCARDRGEPCVLDVCEANAAEYRRGGCDMIIRDFVEAGACQWTVNALRCILIARGADQAFRCRRMSLWRYIR